MSAITTAREAYAAHFGHTPTNFDLVASGFIEATPFFNALLDRCSGPSSGHEGVTSISLKDYVNGIGEDEIANMVSAVGNGPDRATNDE